MGSPRRWLERQRLFAERLSLHSGGDSEERLRFWRSGRDNDPGAYSPILRADRAGPALHEAGSLGCPWRGPHWPTHARAEWTNARDLRGIAPLGALFIFNDTAPGGNTPAPMARSKPTGL